MCAGRSIGALFFLPFLFLFLALKKNRMRESEGAGLFSQEGSEWEEMAFLAIFKAMLEGGAYH